MEVVVGNVGIIVDNAVFGMTGYEGGEMLWYGFPGEVHYSMFHCSVRSGTAPWNCVRLLQRVLNGQLQSSTDFLLPLLAVALSTCLCPVLGFAVIIRVFAFSLKN